MKNNDLNKNNAGEQDTPAPYFIIAKNGDEEAITISTKANNANSKQNKSDNTPAQYIKEKNITKKSYKHNTQTPIQNKKDKAENADKSNKEIKNDNNIQIVRANNADNLSNQSVVENKKDKKEKRKPKTKKPKAWVWIVKVFVTAVGLSLAFSLLSEFTLSKTNIAVSIVVILVFIAVSIVFDMLGLAVASCPIEPFTAMAARKVAGSKLAISLIKNADKVSAICCDVIGDVCGILAGAGGASILTKIALTSSGFMPIFVASLISAIIAGLTIGGKASFKRLARAKSSPITLKFAQVLNLFVHKK